MIRMVQSGKAVIAAEALGPAEGVPLVLVMGATASMLWWPDDLLAGLTGAGFRVIRFDHRDTGLSSRSAGEGPDYAVEDMAGDVLAVMDAFGVARAHLAGMSLGGLIGQILAVEAPERLASLTLIGAEPLGWEGPPLPGIAPAFMDHFAGFAALDWDDRAGVEAFLLGIARLCAGSGAPFDAGRERVRIRREQDRNPDLRAAFRHGALAMARHHAGWAARIGLPVEVIHGAEDPILPLVNGQALARAVPGARLTVLEGLGHELPARAVPALVVALSGLAGLAHP